MGWLGRGVAALVMVSLIAGCTSAPPGATPDPGTARKGQSSSSGYPSGQVPEDCEADMHPPKRQMRGAWIATVRNIDWPSDTGLDAEQQKQELRDQFDRVQELNLNTVFFHVRPTADALYESDKEPWARYLTGEQGGDPGYDPLSFALKEAHKRGLELHAWFNPYRVGWKEPDLEGLVESHPVREHPDWLVEYADQGFFDPGNPDVQQWVSDVVIDVVQRYDIDGVHFDDYFYPYPAEGEKFDDDASWNEYGDGFDTRDDWRRNNVTTLIADIHERINETKPWVQFGVSPFGIWRNKDTDPHGSVTSGLQSYDALYADTRGWIRAEIIDYVVPQLYWPQGFETADYAKLVPWWSDTVSGTDVDLYVGQAAYKVGDEGWKEEDALSTQLDFNTDHQEVAGDVYFSMTDLNNKASAAIERTVADHYPTPALPPVAAETDTMPQPVRRLDARSAEDRVELEWGAVDKARFYAVYRVSAGKTDPCEAIDGRNLLAVTGAQQQTFTDSAPPADPVHYYVTAVDTYRAQGPPSPAAPVNGR